MIHFLIILTAFIPSEQFPDTEGIYTDSTTGDIITKYLIQDYTDDSLGNTVPGDTILWTTRFTPGNLVRCNVEEEIVELSEGYFRYDYRIINLPESRQKLVYVYIPTTSKPDSTGSPSSWNYGWRRRDSVNRWGAAIVSDTFQGLEVGDTLSGFLIKDSHIPSIQEVKYKGPSIRPGLPIENAIHSEMYWKVDSVSGYAFRAYLKDFTVGPGPEVPYPPVVAAESLEVLLNRCLEIGWITDSKTADHLQRILKRVKRHLNAGRISQAEKANQQFRDWVMKKREDQPRGTIRYEAYYVLFYRSKYLFSGSGGGGPVRKDG